MIPGEAKLIDDMCVKTGTTHVSIISWTEVLNTLLLTVDRSAPEMKDDLLQLIGFCKEMENTSFVPFKNEDFGADIAKGIDRYYMVIDSTTELLLSAAEIDEQDTHTIIVIGIAAIVPHHAMADSLMDEISAFIEENCEAEILEETQEIR